LNSNTPNFDEIREREKRIRAPNPRKCSDQLPPCSGETNPL
jgi:hypothetical protein